MRYRDTSLKFGYFLIGLGAGTVATLLFAPRSGRQTRKFIAGKTADFMDEGKDLVMKGKDRLVDTLGSCTKFAA